MLINNFALYVNEFHNKEGNPVYLVESDSIQFDLINYILEKAKRPPVMSLNNVNQVGDKNENPQNSDKLIQGHYKKNNFMVEIIADNIFELVVDIIVVPMDKLLKFNGKESILCFLE